MCPVCLDRLILTVLCPPSDHVSGVSGPSDSDRAVRCVRPQTMCPVCLDRLILTVLSAVSALRPCVRCAWTV